MITIEQGLLAYMWSRCKVSSQHKLPTRDELFNATSLTLLWDRQDIDLEIDRLIANKQIIAYGPYLSDHEIDVL